MGTYYPSETVFDLHNFTTVRDLSLDDGNNEFFGGFFREYDFKDGTAAWFRASKVFIRIVKKEQNKSEFKGFCRLVSFSDPLFDRKMKHGRRYKVMNYMEMDDFEKYMQQQQMRNDKERRDRLIKEEIVHNQNAEKLDLNQDNVDVSEIENLDDVQKAFSATIPTTEFDYLKDNNIEFNQQYKSMIMNNELTEKWEENKMNDRINQLFQPGEFFKYQSKYYQKLNTRSLGFKDLGHILLYNFQTLDYKDLFDILVQEGFSLVDFGDISQFGRLSDKKANPDNKEITKSKKRRKKRNNFLKDSEEYKELGRKLHRYKLNYLINKNVSKAILGQVIRNKLVKKWFTVYFGNSVTQKFRIVYLPSGSGKTTLVNNFPQLFISMDELYNPFEKERMNMFFNEDRVDFKKLNALHRHKVATYYDLLIKDKILLAHSPEQIPQYLKENAEELILIPDDYRKIRFFESNMRGLLKHDLPIVKVERELYLFVITLFFRLELFIVKKKYVRSAIS